MKPKPEESSLLRECSHILEFLTCASPFNAEARAELIRNSSPAITSWYRWQYSRSYRPARRRKRSELCCRHSRWDESSSVERSSHFSRHSSTTWKHFPAKILNESDTAQVPNYLGLSFYSNLMVIYHSENNYSEHLVEAYNIP